MIIGGWFSPSAGDIDRVTLCWWQSEFSGFISGCRQMRLAAGYQFDGGAKTKLHSPDFEVVNYWMPLPNPPEQ